MILHSVCEVSGWHPNHARKAMRAALAALEADDPSSASAASPTTAPLALQHRQVSGTSTLPNLADTKLDKPDANRR